ncbi:MAG TPA: PPC domain-containing DNA-binding protein [Burkholderiales bacterium]|jgi:predicted DNA-binding protein with PD1-like motif|nr:PPC domain-containing DNA-binding protein [Burkholderiales bacterium]
MQTRTLANESPRIIAVVLETGEELVASLTRFAQETGLHASQVTAIGAFQRAVLGFYDFTRRDYKRIPVDEQVELLSLLGDISTENGKPKLHLHAVVGREDGSARGGHLLEAIVHPTLEAIITETPAYMVRRFDPRSGLSLIQLDSR